MSQIDCKEEVASGQPTQDVKTQPLQSPQVPASLEPPATGPKLAQNPEKSHESASSEKMEEPALAQKDDQGQVREHRKNKISSLNKLLTKELSQMLGPNAITLPPTNFEGIKHFVETLTQQQGATAHLEEVLKNKMKERMIEQLNLQKQPQKTAAAPYASQRHPLVHIQGQDILRTIFDKDGKTSTRQGGPLRSITTQATSNFTAVQSSAQTQPQKLTRFSASGMRSETAEVTGLTKPETSLQQINSLINTQVAKLMDQSKDEQQLRATNLYKDNSPLLEWLEKNWEMGSMCMKKISQQQMDQMNQETISCEAKKDASDSNNKSQDSATAANGNSGSRDSEHLTTILSNFRRIHDDRQSTLTSMLNHQLSQAPVRVHVDYSDAAATKDFPINLANPDSLPSSPMTDVHAQSDLNSVPHQGLQKLIESESQQVLEQISKFIKTNEKNMSEQEIQQLSSAVNIISNFKQQRSPKLEPSPIQRPMLGKRPHPSNYEQASQGDDAQNQLLIDQMKCLPANLFDRINDAQSQKKEMASPAIIIKQPDLEPKQLASKAPSIAGDLTLQQMQQMLGPKKSQSAKQVEEGQDMNDDSSQDSGVVGQAASEMPLATGNDGLSNTLSCITGPNFGGLQIGGALKKRIKKNLSTEAQILKTLREVIDEQDLVDVRNKILEVIRKYQKDMNKIIIEANLPKKNHNHIKNNFRGSKFRGPSKNRKKWQVMKMINKETVRIGGIKSELEAARIYDFLAILTEGLNAKTNFNYNVEQLYIIIKEFYFNQKNQTDAAMASQADVSSKSTIVNQFQEPQSSTFPALSQQASQARHAEQVQLPQHFQINNQLSNNVQSPANFSALQQNLLQLQDQIKNGTYRQSVPAVDQAARLHSERWAQPQPQPQPPQQAAPRTPQQSQDRLKELLRSLQGNTESAPQQSVSPAKQNPGYSHQILSQQNQVLKQYEKQLEQIYQTLRQYPNL